MGAREGCQGERRESNGINRRREQEEDITTDWEGLNNAGEGKNQGIAMPEGEDYSRM